MVCAFLTPGKLLLASKSWLRSAECFPACPLWGATLALGEILRSVQNCFHAQLPPLGIELSGVL